MSKLCGRGAGEKPCWKDDCSCAKAFARFVCVIGFIVSAVFLLGLIVLSLVKYKYITFDFLQTPLLRETSAGL